MAPYNLDAGPIEIVRRNTTRILGRSRTTSLRVRLHVRDQARGTGLAHATLEAEKGRDIHASVERNVRVGFFDYAVDLAAFGAVVSGDVTLRGLGGRRGRGDEGYEGDGDDLEMMWFSMGV